MEKKSDNRFGFIVLLQRWCNITLRWEERSRACHELATLVGQGLVRDDIEDKVTPETYRLLVKGVQLGWQQEEGSERDAVQSLFTGIIAIPEFETAAIENFLGDVFLVQLCGRFQAGVAEERIFLRDTLHWVYASFPGTRPLLRRQIGSVLGQFVRTPTRNAHVAEVLHVVCQIIKGFPERLTEVHRSLLLDVILPLHEPNQMAMWSTQQPIIESYHQALVGCLIPLLERQADLVQQVFKAIVAAWPQGFESNTPKEVLLLHEVGALVKFIGPDVCEPVCQVVMPKILECLRVDNSRVVERALFLFKDESFMELLGRRSHAVMKPLLAALLRGGEPFWNPTVTKMSAHVLETLERMDPETFAAACESLWGNGVPPAADVILDSLETKSVSGLPSEKDTFRVNAAAGHSLPPVTLTGAMGSWRPPAQVGTRQSGILKAARNPPTTVTGVAPWAFPTPQLPSAIGRDSQSTRTSRQGNAPPLYTLKRPLPRDPTSLDQSGDRPNNDIDAGEALVSEVPRTTHANTDSVSSLPSKRTDEESVACIRSTVMAASTVHAGEGGVSEKVEGLGLRRVREFIIKMKPKTDEGKSHPSWQEQQLEPTPTLLPDLRFHDLVFGHELGQGSFSSVKYARQITKGRTQSEWPEFAVKIISTSKIEELHYEKSVTNEIACLRVLSHPGIARLISAFRWRDGAYLVLEYAARGDLHTHVKQHGSLSEVSARFVIGEVVAALCSVHDCGFVFGDLKPENILITENGHIKIADFGACRPATCDAKDILNHSRDALRTLRDGDWRVAAGLPPNPVYTIPVGRAHSDSDSEGGEEDDEEPRTEGTAAYLPPEVARGGIPDVGADAWALGCVTFLCLAGRPPIFADTDAAIMDRVVRFEALSTTATGVEDSSLPSLPAEVSQASQSLVRQLMEPDRQVRLSVECAAKHDFFTNDNVDVFALHRQKPVELAQGTVAPAPNAAWSRRQNSMIWAPMPQEYRLDMISRELEAIAETEVERGQPFWQRLGAIREPRVSTCASSRE